MGKFCHIILMTKEHNRTQITRSGTGNGNEHLIAVFDCMNVTFVRSVSEIDALIIVSPGD